MLLDTLKKKRIKSYGIKIKVCDPATTTHREILHLKMFPVELLWMQKLETT